MALALMALVMLSGVSLLLVYGKDDTDNADAPTTSPETVSSAASTIDTSAPPTDPATSQLAAPPVTQPPATAPLTTVPATVESTTTTMLDPAATPTVPAVTPIGGFGNPQVLSNPLPSGATYDQVIASLGVAQALGDALANDDWDTARILEPANSGLSNQNYIDGYNGLDRASLLLVDAQPEDAGYRLLMVSVANERSGQQTTLYCVEWSVDPFSMTVTQHHGAVGQIARVPYALSPEGVRNDAALDAAVRSECHWS